jgi:hypothetical protein
LHPDPFQLFGHYATALIDDHTRLSLVDGGPHAWKAVADDSLFIMSHKDRPPDAQFDAALAGLAEFETPTVAELSDRISLPIESLILAVAFLAKWEIVDLWPGPSYLGRD